MGVRETESSEEFVRAAARLVGLPMAAEYEAGVRMNLERIAAVAAPLLAEPVSDEMESAQVFEP
jgi:hypothetical protein